jgi:membrane protein DedA with SNARE-associated domain
MTQGKRSTAEWQEMERRLAERTMMGRIGQPEDIANAVAFLAAPESGWVTAQTLLPLILNLAAALEPIPSYGYLAIFTIIILESAGVPLPGETTLVAASIYAGSHHALDIRLVIATAATAAILGDNIGYWVGRTLGRKAVQKWGPWIGLDQRKLDLGECLFLRHGGKIVFWGRFAAVLRTFAAVLAGIHGFPPWRFFLFNALGGIAWALTFGTGGYLLGQSFRRVAGPLGWFVLAIAAVTLLYLWRYYKQHEEQLLRTAERDLAALRQRYRGRRRT